MDNRKSINLRMDEATEQRWRKVAQFYGHQSLAGFTRFLLEAASRPHVAGTLHLFEYPRTQ